MLILGRWVHNSTIYTNIRAFNSHFQYSTATVIHCYCDEIFSSLLSLFSTKEWGDAGLLHFSFRCIVHNRIRLRQQVPLVTEKPSAELFSAFPGEFVLLPSS